MPDRSTAKRIMESGYTDFQKKVFLATMEIPKGKVRTYKQVAQAIGKPRAYRAVGSALRINPFAPKVPCHRVIKSSGETGNYSGKGGPEGKVQLLRREKAI